MYASAGAGAASIRASANALENATRQRSRKGVAIIGAVADSGSRSVAGTESGKPIVVVSGLPRSGTSMAMRMLEAGGLEILSDGLRVADESNPNGYFEDERVKSLHADPDKSWLKDARGKAVKIISFLLRDLPGSNHYRVIFMQRNLDEVMASQRQMLGAAHAGDAASDARLAAGYADHLAAVKVLLAERPYFDVLYLEHQDVMRQPAEHAEQIARFLGGDLDVAKMAAAVDPKLHRNRR
jgi:hypothetical protein